MSRELALYTCVERMEQGTGKGEAWQEAVMKRQLHCLKKKV